MNKAAVDGIFAGLISGTSMDGVDVALVSFSGDDFELLRAQTTAYPESLRSALLELILPEQRASLAEIAALNTAVGRHFASAFEAACDTAGIGPDAVTALGSHGQTIYHEPKPPVQSSWQIGDAATLAVSTGVTTVYDFRSIDVARGGEGAPLVPPFHRWCFARDGATDIVVNVGGISNISVIDAAREATLGFDCGPGNCLMDLWHQKHRDAAFDRDGAWAASGHSVPALLARLLADDYFSQPQPKSTGREYFNAAWLEAALHASDTRAAEPVDVQATLMALTVETIARDIEALGVASQARVFICGGGAFNNTLLAQLDARLGSMTVATTAALGLDPAFVEATAFAWLARQRISEIPVPLATGADDCAPALLGAIMPAPA